MIATRYVTAAILVGLANGPSLAADLPAPFLPVVDEARQACAELDGEFDMSDMAILSLDLDGDAENDAVLDTSAFACSTAASLYSGTGGAPYHLLVDGTITTVTGHDLTTIELFGGPVVLVARHGSACNGLGYQRCVEALVWDEGAFRTVGAEE